MSERHHAKALILGSGPAGLTAAIYTARASLEPMLVHGIQPGGQMTITTDVENYPGFAEVVQGPWLMEQMQMMEQMQKQAEAVGTVFFHDTIVSVDLSKRPFVCAGDSGTTYSGDSLIVSTGAVARWLGLESEERFMGFGVSACATCDGFFFRDREVLVVGGGNTAVEEALYLTNHATKVTLVHRRDELRAEKILQQRLFANPKIEVLWDHVAVEVLGGGEPPFFVAIGHSPSTELFRGQLDMDDEGYLITAPDSTATKIPGVFAAGDVQDKIYRQAVTAAGTGCMAAIEAEKFLAREEAVSAAAAE
jgi:thioredoxin reductase (NADPH)